MSSRTIESMFKGKYYINENGCWIWLAAQKSSGYGAQWWNGRLWPAHRLMWIDKNGGEDPTGYDIAHNCHNKLCINPEHLSLTTRSMNMRMSGREGRLGKSLGARQVELIRGLVNSLVPGVSNLRANTLIAECFGVSYKTIEHIRKGHTWGDFR